MLIIVSSCTFHNNTGNINSLHMSWSAWNNPHLGIYIREAEGWDSCSVKSHHRTPGRTNSHLSNSVLDYQPGKVACPQANENNGRLKVKEWWGRGSLQEMVPWVYSSNQEPGDLPELICILILTWVWTMIFFVWKVITQVQNVTLVISWYSLNTGLLLNHLLADSISKVQVWIIQP